MWKCPVCDKENEKPVCIECGFDSSADLEHNHTLTTVGEVLAVSKRREQFQAERENLFICPECHGCYFKVNSADQTLICGNCATITPLKSAVQIPAKNTSVSPNSNQDKQVESSTPSIATDTDLVASGRCGMSVVWNLYESGLMVISGKGPMTDRKSGDPNEWADYQLAIKRIQVEKGVTSIGDFAFIGCCSLESIHIPNGITSIGDYAFSGCCSLGSIHIPDGVTSIGDSAFALCKNLESIRIPDGVTSIVNWAFAYCVNLKSISIPDGVTKIGWLAFSMCENLKNVYYTGSEAEWNKIEISYSNEALKKAKIHFNCT